jgi:hypothetical protein
MKRCEGCGRKPEDQCDVCKMYNRLDKGCKMKLCTTCGRDPDLPPYYTNPAQQETFYHLDNMMRKKVYEQSIKELEEEKMRGLRVYRVEWFYLDGWSSPMEKEETYYFAESEEVATKKNSSFP